MCPIMWLNKLLFTIATKELHNTVASSAKQLQKKNLDYKLIITSHVQVSIELNIVFDAGINILQVLKHISCTYLSTIYKPDVFPDIRLQWQFNL